MTDTFLPKTVSLLHRVIILNFYGTKSVFCPYHLKNKIMAQLVFKSDIKNSLKEVLILVMPYMKGFAYEQILVLTQGKTRMILDRTDCGYKFNGTILTSDKIKKWVS